MNIQESSPGVVPQSLATQALSDATLLHKDQSNVMRGLSQSKSSQLPVLTNIRTYQVVRGENNTLLCKACGRKLPTTSQGKLDTDQLLREMLHPQWKCL